ncbi:hypothetical protein HT031_003779 [Scenedesmus sp. PABB004]|nr:hypothetical protein HT031_003779 [Scenedesmus sp. PABB004]
MLAAGRGGRAPAAPRPLRRPQPRPGRRRRCCPPHAAAGDGGQPPRAAAAADGGRAAVVVGGGWAGFGAALALAKAGASVTLLDASESPGGLSSAATTPAGRVVEPGIKGFWYQYANIEALVAELGIAPSPFTPWTRSSFWSPAGLEVESPIFQDLPRLPAPLGSFVHTAPLFTRLGLADRASAVGLVGPVLEHDLNDDTYSRYDTLSAHDLFASAGVSRALYEQFLSPMLLVTLFAPPTELSAAAALGALQYFALAHQPNFDVRWCRGPIGELIFAPLVRRLSALGVRVLGGRRAEAVLPGGGTGANGGAAAPAAAHLPGAVVAHGPGGALETHAADAIVLATGVPGLQGLVSRSPVLAAAADLRAAAALPTSAVLAARLWLDAHVPLRCASNVVAGFDAGMGGTVFQLEALQDQYRGEAGSVLEFDIYNAATLLPLPDDALIDRLLGTYLEPALRRRGGGGAPPPPRVLDASVLRFPRAVTRFAPGTAAALPRIATSLANLFVAGDCVAEGPGTHGCKGLSQEKALVSGLQAGNRAAARLGLAPVARVIPVEPDEPHVAAAKAALRLQRQLGAALTLGGRGGARSGGSKGNGALLPLPARCCRCRRAPLPQRRRRRSATPCDRGTTVASAPPTVQQRGAGAAAARRGRSSSSARRCRRRRPAAMDLTQLPARALKALDPADAAACRLAARGLAEVVAPPPRGAGVHLAVAASAFSAALRHERAAAGARRAGSGGGVASSLARGARGHRAARVVVDLADDQCDDATWAELWSALAAVGSVAELEVVEVHGPRAAAAATLGALRRRAALREAAGGSSCSDGGDGGGGWLPALVARLGDRLAGLRLVLAAPLAASEQPLLLRLTALERLALERAPPPLRPVVGPGGGADAAGGAVAAPALLQSVVVPLLQGATRLQSLTAAVATTDDGQADAEFAVKLERSLLALTQLTHLSLGAWPRSRLLWSAAPLLMPALRSLECQPGVFLDAESAAEDLQSAQATAAAEAVAHGVARASLLPAGAAPPAPGGAGAGPGTPAPALTRLVMGEGGNVTPLLALLARPGGGAAPAGALSRLELASPGEVPGELLGALPGLRELRVAVGERGDVEALAAAPGLAARLAGLTLLCTEPGEQYDEWGPSYRPLPLVSALSALTSLRVASAANTLAADDLRLLGSALPRLQSFEFSGHLARSAPLAGGPRHGVAVDGLPAGLRALSLDVREPASQALRLHALPPGLTSLAVRGARCEPLDAGDAGAPGALHLPHLEMLDVELHSAATAARAFGSATALQSLRLFLDRPAPDAGAGLGLELWPQLMSVELHTSDTEALEQLLPGLRRLRRLRRLGLALAPGAAAAAPPPAGPGVAGQLGGCLPALTRLQGLAIDLPPDPSSSGAGSSSQPAAADGGLAAALARCSSLRRLVLSEGAVPGCDAAGQRELAGALLNCVVLVRAPGEVLPALDA